MQKLSAIIILISCNVSYAAFIPNNNAWDNHIVVEHKLPQRSYFDSFVNGYSAGQAFRQQRLESQSLELEIAKQRIELELLRKQLSYLDKE